MAVIMMDIKRTANVILLSYYQQYVVTAVELYTPKATQQ